MFSGAARIFLPVRSARMSGRGFAYNVSQRKCESWRLRGENMIRETSLDDIEETLVLVNLLNGLLAVELLNQRRRFLRRKKKESDAAKERLEQDVERLLARVETLERQVADLAAR